MCMFWVRVCIHAARIRICHEFDSDNLVGRAPGSVGHWFTSILNVASLEVCYLNLSVPNHAHIHVSLDAVRKCLISQVVR